MSTSIDGGKESKLPTLLSNSSLCTSSSVGGSSVANLSVVVYVVGLGSGEGTCCIGVAGDDILCIGDGSGVLGLDGEVDGGQLMKGMLIIVA